MKLAWKTKNQTKDHFVDRLDPMGAQIISEKKFKIMGISTGFLLLSY